MPLVTILFISTVAGLVGTILNGQMASEEIRRQVDSRSFRDRFWDFLILTAWFAALLCVFCFFSALLLPD